MIITLIEIVDMIIMTLAIGFIFKDSFPQPAKRNYDPVEELRRTASGEGVHDNLLFAALVAAPGIILHELSHKFVALHFGIQATFHAAYEWLFAGILLKLLNFPFIFFVPGYVSYPAEAATHIQSALISGAGPLMNLLLFITAWALLKYGKIKNKNNLLALHMMKNINMFLFIFNMIPIPPFDGGNFFLELYRIFTG